MESDSNKTSEVPKWIQTRSWEAELLVSGGATISLLKLYDFLHIQIARLEENTFFQLGGLSEALISIQLLAIYFSIHLIIRAYWLSILFLNKLFPEGLKPQNSSFVEPYRSFNNHLDLAKQINKIDAFCSILFCWSFISVLIVLGTYLSLFILSIPASINIALFPNFNFRLVAIPLITTFFIFLFDLFTFGTLRKNSFSGKLFLPIYWLWNKVTLGFIWRRNLELIFSKSKSKWNVAISIFLIFTLSLALPLVLENLFRISDQRQNSPADILSNEYRYMDKYSPEEWQEVAIQSDVITENYIKVFIPFTKYGDEKIDKKNQNTYSNIIRISINDSTYSNLDWVGITKRNKQKGIQTVISISHLKNGIHLLKVEELDGEVSAIIPFWKQ